MASTTRIRSVGPDRVAERGQLVHQRLVDLQASGGVDDHQVAEVLP
jgi:hypothetical protein